MKVFSIFILTFLMFVASFGNALISWDYQLNKTYYENLCENKDKPKSHCEGKCKKAKDTEKQSQQLELLKIGFEFNILPFEPFEIPTLNYNSIKDKKVLNNFNTQNILKGFSTIQPQPPQLLG